MRKNQTTINLIAFVVLPFVIGIVNLLKMRLFIEYLGDSQNGIYQFYAQFFSYFTLLEAGIELAVCSTLFKYLVAQDYQAVNRIIYAARIYWRRIGILILLLSVVILPLAPLMIQDVSSIWYIILIQALYGLRMTFNYFFAGPQAVALADNRGYLVISLDSVGIISTSIMSMFIALLTRELLFVVVFEVIAMFIFVLVKFSYLKHKFAWLDVKRVVEPNFEFKQAMRGTSVIKITDMIVNNTDLVTVMILLGAAATSNFSIYNNFAILLVMIFGTSLISTMQALLGKKFAHQEASQDEKIIQVRLLKLLNYLVIIIVVPLIAFALNPFIGLFYGTEQVEGALFYTFFIFFIYMKLIRTPYSTLKVSLGNYRRFSRIAISNACANIILSLTFTSFFGLVGVVMGTTVAYILTEWWYELKVFDLEFIGQSVIKTVGKSLGHMSFVMLMSVLFYRYFAVYVTSYLTLFSFGGIIALLYSAVIILGTYAVSPTFKNFLHEQLGR